MEAELNNYWLQVHDEKLAESAILLFRQQAEEAPFIREAFWYFYRKDKLLHDAGHGYSQEQLAQDMYHYRH